MSVRCGAARSIDVAVVNARIAFEILRDRLPADVFDDELRECGGIELETSEIGREDQAPALAQQAHRAADHADVIALNVQHALHALGIREGRRIEKHQIEARTLRRLLLEPLQAIGAIQLVPVRAVAVEHEIVARPVEISVRQIDARAAARAARGRIYRGAAGIAKQIQEILVLRPVAQHAAYEAMIEEQTGVQIVAKIDPELEPCPRSRRSAHSSSRVFRIVRCPSAACATACGSAPAERPGRRAAPRAAPGGARVRLPC